MKKFFILLLIVPFFFSCTSFIYYPNGANAPLFKEKGEMQLALGIKGLGGDIRSAYALSDYFAMQINANFLDVFGTEFGVAHNSGQYYGEGAIGFYKPLSERFIFEGYLGTGLGTTFFRNTEIDYLRTTNYHKIYAQLDVGFRSKYFNIGLAIREAFVNAYCTKINGVITGDQYVDTFFEPILFLALGSEKFKINAQAGFSDSQFSIINNYAPFIFGLGLETRFSLK